MVDEASSPDVDPPDSDDAPITVPPIAAATFVLHGRTFHDVNQRARQSTSSGPTLPGLRGPNRDRETIHAETGAMLKAFDAGLRGGHGTLEISGLVACPYCKGDVKTLARALGLNSLTVVDADGTVVEFTAPGELLRVGDGGKGWT